MIWKEPWTVALLSFVLGLVLCAAFFASVIHLVDHSGVMELPSTADGTGWAFARAAGYIVDRHGKPVAADVAAQQLATSIGGFTVQADYFFARMSPGAQGMTINAMRVFDQSPLAAAGDTKQVRTAREHILEKAKAGLGGDALALGVMQTRSPPSPDSRASADGQLGVTP